MNFSTALWSEISGIIARAFRLDAAESARLAGNKTARLVAALPYLAECEEPKRTALAHLATFVLANTEAARHDFDHKPADDAELLRRLATGASFQGGKPRVLDRGMKLLALVMVAGYERDLGKDAAAKEYNPLGAKAWDGSQLKEQLTKELAATPNLEMDSILTVEEAALGAWEQ